MKIHHAKSHGESLKGVEVECAWCSEEVTKQKSRSDPPCFCDKDCESKWKSENWTGEDNPQYLQKKMTCDGCGSNFTKPPSTIFENNFCCNKCRLDYMNSDKWSGENSPIWEGGSSDYTDGWVSRRKEVRKNKCQDCGMSNEEHLEEYSRKLEVHHITPRRKFDDMEKADRDDNLVTLCIPCHRNRDN